MNIIEALDVALPELPAHAAQRSYPKLDPRVISHEHQERSGAVVLAKLPGSETFVRFPPHQWKLLQLFDGERSYAEIAELSGECTGVSYTEEEVRESAAFVRDYTDLFFKTPFEKNITLKQKLRHERHKRLRISDVTQIQLHEWRRADEFVSWIYPKVRFIYTRRFVLLTLLIFAVMGYMWADRFGEIWRDSFGFFNFTEKSGWDLFEFWVLFAAMAMFHEFAHGLTCKHFGGNVEKMGLMLLYFAVTCYCDVTQVWIYGGRFARIATAIAGLWIDLVLCAVATFVWWSTPTGMPLHDFAYKVMMITGIGVTLLNLNPLIKLDGYYVLSELIHEPDLKERTTEYVSSWVKRRIFRLPVELQYMPLRRRAFYISYCVLSGVYSYSLMLFITIFAYHVFRRFMPDWGFVLALLFGFYVFKSRLRLGARFMKQLYLDKKEALGVWLRPSRALPVAAGILILIFIPFWPEYVKGQFVFEPAQRAVVRAEVPGSVTGVYAEEGQMVAAGAPVVRLRNLNLESEEQSSRAELQVASAKAVQAQLRYGDYGRAEQERLQMAERQRLLKEKVAKLDISSPISGVVVTPRLRDLTGSYLAEGAEVVEIDNLSQMIARIYIPEFEMHNVRAGVPVKLWPESAHQALVGSLLSVMPGSSESEKGWVQRSQLAGVREAQYYVATVQLANNGSLWPGLDGTAKIFVRRRSLGGIAGTFTHELIARRFW